MSVEDVEMMRIEKRRVFSHSATDESLGETIQPASILIHGFFFLL